MSNIQDQRELLELIAERDRRMARRSFHSLFPDEDTVWTGPKTVVFERGERIYARKKYKKMLAAFEATKYYREVNIMSANRVGKTVGVGYAVSCWSTGVYEDWWPGITYDGPIDMWVAGQTNETTRDILQRKLFGDITLINGKKSLSGTGIIPGELLINPPSWKAGVTDLIDTIGVRTVDGGVSRIGMKSYQQGRLSFEGLEKHVIVLDEEPPSEIYNECLIRTMTVKNGRVISSFTPLLGMSDTAMMFLPGGE
jgi:phage terminase large subunit-like protein